jgi:CPA2 family monovalent cation:H+ antiporter-2
MGHEGQEVWLKDTLVFLVAAGVVVPLLRFLRISPVLGFLLAGVVLGPFGLGLLTEQWGVLEFVTISDPEAAAPFAELGVLFLLFLLGLELSPEKLWSLRKVVYGAGGLQAGLSAAAIGAALFALGLTAPAAIAGGFALALSSTAIVMQVMTEQRRAAGRVGQTALAVLLFQDVLVAPILILVGFLTRGGEASIVRLLIEALVQGAFALLIIAVIGRFVLRHVFRLAAQAGGRDFLMALTLLAVVGAAVITAGAGLSVALGAFLAGLLLGETEFKHQAQIDLEPFKGLLLGLFFMTVGMGLDLPGMAGYAPIILGGLAALLIAKALIAFLACRLFAGDRSVSLETAFLLAPAGEFAFVILAAAAAGGVFEARDQTIIAAIAGLSMLATPVFARIGAVVAKRIAPPPEAASITPNYADLSGHVVVAGFGRVGQAIARILKSEDAEMVAIDRDPKRISRERSKGWNVYYGDATRPEFLRQVGCQGAMMFVVTVDDPASAEAIVRAIQTVRPDAPVLARATDVEHALRLRGAGASFVIPDAIEAGLQLAARVLEEFGYTGETVRDRIAHERDEAYARAEES